MYWFVKVFCSSVKILIRLQIFVMGFVAYWLAFVCPFVVYDDLCRFINLKLSVFDKT